MFQSTPPIHAPARGATSPTRIDLSYPGVSIHAPARGATRGYLRSIISLCVRFNPRPRESETVLHSFTGGSSDGADPRAGLIADRAGNLYGTTLGGGASGNGVVFELTGTGFIP